MQTTKPLIFALALLTSLVGCAAPTDSLSEGDAPHEDVATVAEASTGPQPINLCDPAEYLPVGQGWSFDEVNEDVNVKVFDKKLSLLGALAGGAPTATTPHHRWIVDVAWYNKEKKGFDTGLYYASMVPYAVGTDASRSVDSLVTAYSGVFPVNARFLMVCTKLGAGYKDLASVPVYETVSSAVIVSDPICNTCTPQQLHDWELSGALRLGPEYRPVVSVHTAY